MRLLVDTNVILFSALFPERLSVAARTLLSDGEARLLVSAVTMIEVATKVRINKLALGAELRTFRRSLLDAGYEELEVTGDHACGVADLPLLHRDPFDRLLLAQAHHEGTLLVTTDRALAAYPVSVRLV